MVVLGSVYLLPLLKNALNAFNRSFTTDRRVRLKPTKVGVPVTYLLSHSALLINPNLGDILCLSALKKSSLNLPLTREIL